MKIRYLTPLDLLKIDPTGRGRECLSRFKDGEPTPVPNIIRDKERITHLQGWQALRTKMFPEKHRLYTEFDQEHDSKYGGQGRSFSLSTMHNQYIPFFQNAENCNPTWRPSIKLGRDYLIALIKDAIEMYGYPQYGYTKGIEGTSGALPSMSKKGTYQAESSYDDSGWMHPFADLPGQRHMRLRERVINQDAVGNVRYIEDIVSTIQSWLKKYLPQFFSAWLDPRKYTNPKLTNMLRYQCYSVETDYDHCDEHFTFEVASEVVLPICEILIPDKMEYLRFACFVEELFSQPIFMGTYMLEGKHALLSGQVITNMFETVYGVCLALGSIIINGLLGTKFLILVCGDDISVILLSHECAVYEEMIETSNMAGMVMSESKCRIGNNNVRFCRKIYYNGLPTKYNEYGEPYIIGAYPTVLTLNNVINPEKPAKTEIEAWCALIQRIDCLEGVPGFSQIASWIYRKTLKRRVDDTEIQNTVLTDWWSRVYGEPWTLRNSPTYRVLIQNNLW